MTLHVPITFQHFHDGDIVYSTLPKATKRIPFSIRLFTADAVPIKNHPLYPATNTNELLYTTTAYFEGATVSHSTGEH